MENKPLRYCIAKLLDRVGRQRALQIRRKIIAKHCSVTTWYEWLAIERDDSRDIPAAALREFACLIGVPMEQLFTKDEECNEPAL